MSQNNNSPELMSFPASLGKDVAQGQHYMLLDSYESKSAVDKEGSGTRISSIALYIPPGSLTTTIGQNFQALEGGATKAVATGARGGFGETASMLGEAFSGVFTKPKIVADFNAAARGLARNAHMALVYRGPQEFRTHTFNFSFWPKSVEEGKEVQKIIKDIQAGSTPRIAGWSGGKAKVSKLMAPFFQSPRQWEIKFLKAKTGGANPYLFKIGRSVITTITINHDPDTLVSFHSDGIPVHSTLAVTFQEMEYVISQDEVSEQLAQNLEDIKEYDRKRKAMEEHNKLHNKGLNQL